jgi:hypothetical protein
MTPAAEIEPVKVRRVWDGRFYPGKISLIAGEQGVGTTNVAIFLAATVSAGLGWPNSDGSARKGDVIYISTKDSAAETLRPRLEANGADLDRVHIVQELNDEQGSRAFSLLVDLRRLDKELRKLDQPRLIIIDRIDECLTDRLRAIQPFFARADVAPPVGSARREIRFGSRGRDEIRQGKRRTPALPSGRIVRFGRCRAIGGDRDSSEKQPPPAGACAREEQPVARRGSDLILHQPTRYDQRYSRAIHHIHCRQGDLQWRVRIQKET